MTVSAVVGWVQSQVDSMLAYAHPRCMDWPMVSFYHLLAGVVAYLCLLGIAKKVMVARRKGYDMTRFSIVHNLAMTCLSAYMFVETARQAYINNYTLWNNAVDPSPAGYGMARIIYIFYLSKYLEFIDSFIIVARFSKYVSGRSPYRVFDTPSMQSCDSWRLFMCTITHRLYSFAGRRVTSGLVAIPTSRSC